jgi:hypothetical protein
MPEWQDGEDVPGIVGPDVSYVVTTHYEELSIRWPDACLIAAAPDLLEALKEARRLLAECDTSLGVPDLSQFDAAIAKAEGKP